MLKKVLFVAPPLLLGQLAVAGDKCLISLHNLSVGDVVRLSKEQAQGLQMPMARTFIVQEQGANGPAFRPVSPKALKQATAQQPIKLVQENERSLRFKKQKEEQEVERIGSTTVEVRPVQRQRRVSRFNTSLTSVDTGFLVHSENGQYWIVLSWHKNPAHRTGAGSDWASEETVVQVQTLKIEDDAIVVGEKKDVSIGGYNNSKAPSVRVLGQVSKSYVAKATDKKTAIKTVRNRFERGDVFRYQEKNYIVRTAQVGSYSEQGVRPSETWELRVLELADKEVSDLKNKGVIHFPKAEAKSFNQEGGHYGHLGDFTAPVEYLGHYSLGLELDEAATLQLIQSEPSFDVDPNTIELPFVYDYVPVTN